jgi:1-deoxy-D-xylulose-5-phosphate reductoisomerase
MADAMRKRVLILGSTGSIGCSTLDVIGLNPEQFEVVGLVAHRNADRLFQQAQQFSPRFVALLDTQAHQQHAQRFSTAVLASDMESVCAACRSDEVDIVVAAIVGAAGMLPTLAALEAGKTVLLANKESLVLTGSLMMDAARRSGARILPVDSEHNAIFQSLPADFDRTAPAASGVTTIWLTASGGPFRDAPVDSLMHVTPAQAIAHPNWSMGRKISVDSATMANKGLELIEAHWLFGLPSSALKVLIHPQSIVHSLVQYRDGSFLAQLGCPDMRTPIANCLAYPQRIDAGVKPLDLVQIGQLNFSEPDLLRFRALDLARQALEAGGTAPAVFNAANEVAVEAFLNEQIRFMDIPACIDHTLGQQEALPASCVQSVLQADAHARTSALRFCQQH